MSDNAEAYPTQIVVTCGICDGTKDVQWFCKWCAGSLCNTCKISHPRISMFKNHVVVPRTHDIMRLYGPSKIADSAPSIMIGRLLRTAISVRSHAVSNVK
ncbi:hypothetical protein FSP39_023259 [Pinctada imbricata]|uniref:B box-type domain-containing protein n=1 Tax=Pinctada imbricata TaxID=66713 RepID=A0AA88Y740_PINIB|nr:hypothetical protein FSP39_023259 [Pinctada imbricata]